MGRIAYNIGIVRRVMVIFRYYIGKFGLLIGV